MPSRCPSRLFGLLIAALAGLGLLSTTVHAAGTSVSGTVVTRQGDRTVPIFRAMITAREAGGTDTLAVTRTDREGRFLMVDLPSPRLQLSTSKNGFYIRTINGREIEQVVLDCTQNEDCASVAFEMGPSGAVMGMVEDEMGEPLSNVRVVVSTENIPSDPERGWGRQGSETDDRGYFRIAGLKPGNYKVKAQGEFGRMGPPRPIESEQVEVEVDEGAEVQGVQLRVQLVKPAKTFTISGKVTGVESLGEEVYQSLQLRNLDRRNDRFRRYSGGNRIGPDGSFRLEGIAPGRYALSYYAASPLRRVNDEFRLRPMGTISVDSNVSGLVLSPAPATGFAGGVRFETKRVPQEFWLFVSNEGEFAANARISGPDFKFRVDNLTQGKYNVSIREARRGPASVYIKSIRRGSDLVPPRDIEFSEGTVEDVEIIVSDEMARVVGRVKLVSEPGAGQAVRKAAQYQVGLSRGSGNVEIVQADQFGRFDFDNLVPGDYKICAWENLDSQAIHDDKTWEKAGSAVRAFTVEAGNEIEIELTAVP